VIGPGLWAPKRAGAIGSQLPPRPGGHLSKGKGRSPDKDPGLGLVRVYPRATQGGRVLLYNAAGGYSVAATLAASPYDSINVR
jgi:hypothetical protein